MTDQQVRSNDSPAVTRSERRWHAFKRLPHEARENLLRLQNTDGDFLRTNSNAATAKGIVLIILAVLYGFFLAAFEYAEFDQKTIRLIAGGTLLFAIPIAYLTWAILRASLSKVKGRMYLTRTQVIETGSASVRYRDLTDAADIFVNRYWNDTGHRSSLIVTYENGDRYEYTLAGMNSTVELAETTRWQETAGRWRQEAIDAAGRGDTAYFARHDIIPHFAASSVAGREKPALLTPNN